MLSSITVFRKLSNCVQNSFSRSKSSASLTGAVYFRIFPEKLFKPDHFPKHHFRVFQIILIHKHHVFRKPCISPDRLPNRRLCFFLKKQRSTGNCGIGALSKRICRKPDCPKRSACSARFFSQRCHFYPTFLLSYHCQNASLAEGGPCFSGIK